MKLTLEDYDEKLHRAYLELTTPYGGHMISGDMPMYTGKGGKIEFEVALTKEFLKESIQVSYIPEVWFRKRLDSSNYNEEGINFKLIEEFLMLDPERDYTFTKYTAGNKEPEHITFKTKDLPKKYQNLMIGEMVKFISKLK